jgi:hypothetical protein
MLLRSFTGNPVLWKIRLAVSIQFPAVSTTHRNLVQSPLSTKLGLSFLNFIRKIVTPSYCVEGCIVPRDYFHPCAGENGMAHRSPEFRVQPRKSSD